MRKNIVITGYGVIAAKKISKIKHLDFQEFTFPVGEVDYSNTELKNLLGIEAAKELSRTALLGIYALKQAADNAGVTTNTPGKKSLISGTTVGGMDLTEKYWQQIDNHTDIMLQHDCGSCTELTAKYFGFFDECTTISTACSAALNAIIFGADLIRTGRNKTVIAGGTEAMAAAILTPPIIFSLEEAIEFIADDELIEVTPKSIRIRKRILNKELRMKAESRAKKAAENK